MQGRIFIALFICFFSSSLYAQSPTIKKLENYTHECIVKVCGIDTVSMIDPKYLPVMGEMGNSKVVVVSIKILSKLKGDFRHIPGYIMMDLNVSDHLLIYDFVVDKSYKVFGYLSAYTSAAVLKKYRKRTLTLDHVNPPVMIR